MVLLEMVHVIQIPRPLLHSWTGIFDLGNRCSADRTATGSKGSQVPNRNTGHLITDLLSGAQAVSEPSPLLHGLDLLPDVECMVQFRFKLSPRENEQGVELRCYLRPHRCPRVVRCRESRRNASDKR